MTIINNFYIFFVKTTKLKIDWLFMGNEYKINKMSVRYIT